MGKQQSRRSPAMSAPPPPRRRKKKGRPSLLDLQKRSLRLEQQLQEQQQPQARRSNRRDPASADDEDDDGPASGSGRREKKLRLVMGLHDGSAKVGALPFSPLFSDSDSIRAESAPILSIPTGIYLIWGPWPRSAYGSARPRAARGNFFAISGMKRPHLFIYLRSERRSGQPRSAQPSLRAALPIIWEGDNPKPSHSRIALSSQ
jgi:hypothetical protein